MLHENLQPVQKLFIIAQVLAAVAYLHGGGLVHRAICANAISVASPTSYLVRLGQFAFCRHVRALATPDFDEAAASGSLACWSPERLLRGPLSPMSVARPRDI